jgi:RecA-family ATPase
MVMVARRRLLPPDREQIARFVDGMFRHAGDGFVSLRSFYDSSNEPFQITASELSGEDLGELIDAAEVMTSAAAKADRPVVFCPPIAIFDNRNQAREKDLVEGLALSVECDQQPTEAREKLEKILGPATFVVASGGEWLDSTTGEYQAKLHLHWRLSEPATGDALAELKKARKLAAELVGADTTNKTIVHPIRWPGSWHRKSKPVLCRILAANLDQEIDLTSSLETLEKEVPEKVQHVNGLSDERTPWADLVSNILTGDGYHDAIAKLSAKLLTAGADDGAAVNLLRGIMENAEGPHDERWDARFSDIPRAVSTAREKFGEEAKPAIALPFINMSNWDREATPGPDWGVQDRFPNGETALMSGEGGAGKSTTLLHLAACHVLGVDWLGAATDKGAAVFIDCEDRAEVLHWRLEAIRSHYGVSFKDLIAGGLSLVSMVGHDPLLATPGRSGKIEPTKFYKRVLEMAGDLKPKFIGIASVANIYAGSEIERTQVQQFVGLTTKIAMVAGGYLAIASHPSITGIKSESGISGSTQWHNAVRARAYLTSVKTEAGEQPDSDLRQIVFKKNQYGRMNDAIVLRYQNGMYLPVEGLSLEAVEAADLADEIFLILLDRYQREGRHVNDKAGKTYAPAAFAREDEAKGAMVSSASLEAAMRRLFKSGDIHNEQYGRPSRPHFRIVRVK